MENSVSERRSEILTKELRFNQLQRMAPLKSAQERTRRSGRSEAVRVCWKPRRRRISRDWWPSPGHPEERRNLSQSWLASALLVMYQIDALHEFAKWIKILMRRGKYIFYRHRLEGSGEIFWQQVCLWIQRDRRRRDRHTGRRQGRSVRGDTWKMATSKLCWKMKRASGHI